MVPLLSLLVALLCAVIVTMASTRSRVVLISFSDATDSVRAKVPSNVDIKDEAQLRDFLNNEIAVQSFKTTASQSYKIESYDPKSNGFSELKSSIFPFAKGTLSVLLVATTLSQPIAQIRGRSFTLEGNRLPILLANNSEAYISIGEVDSAASLGTGLNTWDGSIVLTKYLEQHRDVVFERTVLELGSGTGCCGIAAALLGAKQVLLTDLDYTLVNLQRNIDKTMQSQPTQVESAIGVQLLDWGAPSTYRYPQAPQTQWDIILGADIIWLESLVPLLVTALEALCHENTVFYLAHQKRSERTNRLLFEMLSTSFTVTQIPREDHHPEYQDNRIDIYIVHKRRLRSEL